MKKIMFFIIIFCLVVGVWFFYSEIYTAEAQKVEKVSFQIKNGEDVSAMTKRLADEQVVRNAWLFRRYLIWKGIDRKIQQGDYEVDAPITIARVANTLLLPGVGERTITIIPGWDLRDIAEYFEQEGIASSTEFYDVVGLPAYNYKAAGQYAPQPFDDVLVLQDKSDYFGLEGYLSPDTFRVFKDASITDIVSKLVQHRDSQFTEEMYADIEASGRSVYEVITVASLLEREVRGEKNKKVVSDLFWRRYDLNWALQADSTVHYAVGKKGNVFTTKEDRDSLSPWNTYKYPGLPLGPISNPSFESIMAAMYPTPNDYWYFLTTPEGEVKYAKTLEEHNVNVNRYLR
ncbi:MAG: hypothetical protein A2479_01730 [Candidatus Magasanikbacteria bacterium RIFOXYC2_FULL_39_8]|nr:MAG: hypothetical protein A2479_01730 [Candidatus Magasanikbacteria bacterium RIFOXYC2_FULL_39_8]